MTTPAVDETLRETATDSVTFSFADRRAQLYGLARLGVSRDPGGELRGSALALLFAGRDPVSARARGGLELDGGAGWESLTIDGVRATVEEPLQRWTVAFDDGDGNGFALDFTALGDAAALDERAPAGALGGMAGYDQPCRVRGSVRAGGRDRAFEGLGQRGHSWGDADWERIELARTVTAWTDTACAALTSIRPAGAGDHAREATWAAVWEPDRLLEVEDGRLSTTYDAEGHTRRAGLELWTRDGEWPHRASGEVLCGSSLELGALRLDCAFFQWRLEGQEGVGRYDIVRREA